VLHTWQAMNEHVQVICWLLALIGLCAVGIVAGFWPRRKKVTRRVETTPQR